MSDSYKKLLELLDFDTNEISKYENRLNKAFERIGLTDDKIKFAINQWIPRHFDISLLGIRKFIGALLREIIDISSIDEYRRKGCKIIYGTVPSPVSLYISLLKSNTMLYVGTPDIFLTEVLGSLFNFLESQLENKLSGWCRHCALNRLRINSAFSELIPSPDIIVSWGTTCDEARKTDEYINCMYKPSWSYYSIQLPHDTHFNSTYEETKIRRDYLVMQIEDMLYKLRKDFKITVTDEQFFEGIKIWNRLAFKINYLNYIVCTAKSVPLGGNELSIINSALLMQFNTGTVFLEEALDILIKEVKKRIRNKEGILPDGTPKLCCFFVPFCIPQVDRMFRENGICLTFSTAVSYSDVRKKRLQEYDSCIVIADNWINIPIVNNMKYEFEAICKMINRYGADGILMGFFDFDRWMGVHQKLLCSMVNKKLRLPNYYIEGDFWNNTMFYSERVSYKIETICSTILSNQS